jgi:hypothetical protein
MYMWRELDLGAVRAEFAHMRELGFSVVRFFLLTEDFLPEPTRVASDKVAQLVEVARIASEERIATIPTLITINMSGKMWWPSFMREPRSNLFADPSLLRSQVLLVETCARALAGDASIPAFDLSNELDDAQALRFSGTELASGNAATRRQVPAEPLGARASHRPADITRHVQRPIRCGPLKLGRCKIQRKHCGPRTLRAGG